MWYSDGLNIKTSTIRDCVHRPQQKFREVKKLDAPFGYLFLLWRHWIAAVIQNITGNEFSKMNKLAGYEELTSCCNQQVINIVEHI